jgi:hypothetical protein
MRVEFNVLDIDELTLGIFMGYNNDDGGEFHITTIGLLLFEINLIFYINYKKKFH